MPLYVRRDIHRQSQWKVYASGSRLTWRQKHAIVWNHSSQDYWRHDSFLPPVKHFGWIIPLHIPLFLFSDMAFAAETAPGQIWMGILATIGLLLVTPFWLHLYRNHVLKQLRRRTLVANIGGDDRLYYLADRDNRPDDFSEWFYSQLKKEAPYFGQVHVITDEYLRVTFNAYKLQKSLGLGWYSQISDDFEAAAGTAYEKLRPIYEKAKDEKNRREQEEQARIASETEFRKGEDRRLTNQRIAMAKDDITSYVQGHQELAETNFATHN